MKKRPSRRRIKARARLGQRIAWMDIVDRRLETWGDWERRHDYQDAHLMPPVRRSLTTFYPYPFFLMTSGDVDYLTGDNGNRRWMPIA